MCCLSQDCVRSPKEMQIVVINFFKENYVYVGGEIIDTGEVFLKFFLKWSLPDRLCYNTLKSFKFFFPLVISDNIPFGAYGNPKKI